MQGGGRLFRPWPMTLYPVIREKNQSRVPGGGKKGDPLFSAQATPDSASQRFSPRSVFRPQAPDPFPSPKRAKVANKFWESRKATKRPR